MIHNILDNGEAMVKFSSNNERKLQLRQLTKVCMHVQSTLSIVTGELIVCIITRQCYGLNMYMYMYMYITLYTHH